MEVDEDMDGYSELLLAVEQRFQVPQASWFRDVAVPAFKRNFRTIWGDEFEWDK